MTMALHYTELIYPICCGHATFTHRTCLGRVFGHMTRIILLDSPQKNICFGTYWKHLGEEPLMSAYNMFLLRTKKIIL